jgi:hypothetical protein
MLFCHPPCSLLFLHTYCNVHTTYKTLPSTDSNTGNLIAGDVCTRPLTFRGIYSRCQKAVGYWLYSIVIVHGKICYSPDWKFWLCMLSGQFKHLHTPSVYKLYFNVFFKFQVSSRLCISDDGRRIGANLSYIFTIHFGRDYKKVVILKRWRKSCVIYYYKKYIWKLLFKKNMQKAKNNLTSFNSLCCRLCTVKSCSILKVHKTYTIEKCENYQESSALLFFNLKQNTKLAILIFISIISKFCKTGSKIKVFRALM